MIKSIHASRTAVVIGLLSLVNCLQAQSKAQKEAADLKYRGKFLISNGEGGVAVGLCSEKVGLLSPGFASAMNVINDSAHVTVLDKLRCGLEPVKKGEVLKILEVHLFKAPRASKSSGIEKGAYLELVVQTVSPHSISRGTGGFSHESLERGEASIAIRAGESGDDFGAANSLAAQWFTLVNEPTPESAAQLGNTASGVFVHQVKVGMSFAEVEGALGLPQTRVDLGEKVLYKYETLTVEFRGGRVADVR